MKFIYSFLFAITLFVFSVSNAYAEMVITYRAPESEGDPRYEYDNALLRLALDKTVEEYGSYKMVASPVMNFARAIRTAQTNALPNFFFKQSYESGLTDDLIFAPIPLDRGIVGYRVFFVSNENKDKLKDVKTLDDLKGHSIIQGRGWSDVKILRNAGFKVDVLSHYEQLFDHVAQEGSDLFSRGANELLSEYEAYKHIKGLNYDQNLALYYPLPRFFFTHASNKEAMERVKLGLEKAWKDGSFQKLWEDQYLENINALKLKERTIFKIENPLLKGLDDGYQKYFYDPFGGNKKAAQE